MAHHGAETEQPPKIPVARLGDPAEPLFAAFEWGRGLRPSQAA